MANKYVKQEKYGLLLLVELVHVLSWSVTVLDWPVNGYSARAFGVLSIVGLVHNINK